MALLGEGVIAMWADFAAEVVPDFEDWHTHEHMHERLGIPGFLRGTRWSARGEEGASYFMMYELVALEVFASGPYLERLNNPTPWTRRVMPHFRNMMRSPCRTAASVGAGVGAALLTIRFSPQPGEEARLRGWLAAAVLHELAARRGLASAHLLVAQPHLMPPPTAEQRVRGGDAAADWVLLVQGYDPEAVARLPAEALSGATLAAHGAAPGAIADVYRFDCALTNVDAGTPDRRLTA